MSLTQQLRSKLLLTRFNNIRITSHIQRAARYTNLVAIEQYHNLDAPPPCKSWGLTEIEDGITHTLLVVPEPMNGEHINSWCDVYLFDYAKSYPHTVGLAAGGTKLVHLYRLDVLECLGKVSLSL